MSTTTLAIMPVVVIMVLAGCVTAGRQVPTAPELLPIALNEKCTQKLDYGALGKPGQRVTVYGMLRNARKWEESKQEQWLLASPPEAPFSEYAVHLAEPILQFPPCDPRFADPPGKSLVGPYKMTGTIGTAWTDPELTYSRSKYYQLTEVKSQELHIASSIPTNCAAAVHHHWQQIGRVTITSGPPATEADRGSSHLSLSDFVRQHDPILLSLSIDGEQAVYCCAEGRKYLSWHGEALARVYCLVNLRQGKPIKLYIETSAYGIE